MEVRRTHLMENLMATQDRCPTADGGNHNITNQDEAMILAAAIGSVPIRTVPLGMEDDSHVSPSHRDGSVAGS
jgi:hypothetical protein